MLELKQIRFAYPGQASPYDFSMRVAAGEIVTIAGRSGSGKSTLLDLIAGFQKPSSGTMALDGDNLLSLPPESRPVSILFQANNLFDHLSVEQNLELGLGRNPDDAPQQIAAALEEVGLSEFAGRRAGQLSGGQQQRVALARTLLREKPVLLLDEPFASLDRQTADEMRELVRRMTSAHDWHTIVVSHLAEDATELADRTYSLSAGVLSESAAA